MKQTFYLAAALFALCLALAAGPAFAQDGGDQKIMTIQEVRGTDNGSEVTFKGKITKSFDRNLKTGGHEFQKFTRSSSASVIHLKFSYLTALFH